MIDALAAEAFAALDVALADFEPDEADEVRRLARVHWLADRQQVFEQLHAISRQTVNPPTLH